MLAAIDAVAGIIVLICGALNMLGVKKLQGRLKTKIKQVETEIKADEIHEG